MYNYIILIIKHSILQAKQAIVPSVQRNSTILQLVLQIVYIAPLTIPATQISVLQNMNITTKRNHVTHLKVSTK